LPKIRSLKRSYFRSQTVRKMSRPARLTLAGVIASMADDEGRFVADARLVRTEVYPWDDDVSDQEIEAHLCEAAAKTVGLVRFYRVAGVRYAVFPKWGQHQWISKKSPSSIPAIPIRHRHHADTVSVRHARALDEGNRNLDGDEGREMDDFFRKGEGALSKKLDDPFPTVGVPVNGDGHAAAVDFLTNHTDILRRQDPVSRTLAQEEAAQETRRARAGRRRHA
jgi:hypothetical protein